MLRQFIRQRGQSSPHPVTPETVGWLRVHVDDLHRLVFVDEVQSDVIEDLLELGSGSNAEARKLAREWADWHVDGFSSVRHWAASIGYQVGLHSTDSAKAIPGKTRSTRKWSLYYGTLIKRFELRLQPLDGYPGPIFVGR